MTVWDMVSTERRRLADELETFSDQEWRTQSQCEAWSVEALAAHLITPFETSNLRFAMAMIKNRGRFDTAIIDLTARVQRDNSRAGLISKLREHADNQWTPPGRGPGDGSALVLAEIVVHGQDIRRALGREHDVPVATIEAALNGITDDDVRDDYARRIGAAQPSG